MLEATVIEAAIKDVSAKGTQAAFLQRLLVDTLQWPIDPTAKTVEETAFEWTADELKASDLSQKIVDNRVWQIQTNPVAPWGVFLLEFKHPDAFHSDRGMTGPLRTILRSLVPKARASALPGNRPVWKREHLLFICTHQYQHFRFAYFKAPEGQTKTAPLAAFGWSPDVPARTACEHNLPHLQWPTKFSPEAFHETWADAFNVEKVTKKFYEDYRQVFELAETVIGEDNPIKGEELRLFTQSLFNRLMFLRFIERKGWLKFGQSKNYLRELFQAGPIGKRSFFNARLKPLFFEGLAKEHDKPSEVFGDVPFLNGGLFEAGATDAKVADIPDKVFANILDRERGLFYRYNFTVEESTPLDIEVAVDPEMLGKVFEELVTGRHESGSYYTPRPVVSFMCREALKGYLASATKAPESAIAALVDEHEVEGLNQSHVDEIIAALDKLKAVDPACGSGAYLLGLLHELIAIYRALQNQKIKPDARFFYKAKLRIISHNLYGVDIDPFATSVAMLRLWLSLAVDSDDPVALPNLEFKIETGDSVCGPNPQGPRKDSDTVNFLDARLASVADDLVGLKDDYLTAHGARKAEFKAIIQKQETEIAHELQLLRAKGIIMWRVQFAEAFSKRGGFDIVLANPPYIRQELIKDLKPTLKKVYGQTFSGTADIYVFFYLRALQLLNHGGMLVFISSNKWFRAGYGEKLRSLIAKTISVQTILDFHDLPVFDSAIAYPMIFIAANQPPTNTHAPILAEPASLDPPYPDIAAVVARFGHALPVTSLGVDGAWHLASSGTAKILSSMRASGKTLEAFLGSRVYRGITTGFNDAFVIDDNTRTALIRAEPKCKEIIRPFSAGKNIKRWRIEHDPRWIIFTRRGTNIEEYPAIKRHLAQWKADLQPKAIGASSDSLGRKPGSYKWYEIQDEIAYYEEFDSVKIVSTKVSIEPTFALDTGGRYLANTSYFIPASKDALYVLGVLNSSPSRFYAQNVFVGKQNGWYEVQPTALEEMPIPTASASDRAAIVALAQKCLDAKGVNCEPWEKEIDERVAALYGIDLADIEGTSRPTPIYETKAYLKNRTIPKLSQAAPDFPYFSLVAIRKDLDGHRGAVEPESLNSYLHELTREGAIFDAGRGWYSTLPEPFVLDREPVRALVEKLEKRFPYLDFSCWSTAQIAAYSHQQLAKFVHFVYTERDAMESVAEALREAEFTAYINPAKGEVGRNVRLLDGVVIVRPAITRAPVDGKYAAIEKILVDLYIEAGGLRLMDEEEHERIVKNIITHGRISISTLVAYADDRRNVSGAEVLHSAIN